MKCPECGYVTFDDLSSCKRCGADWFSSRARLDIEMPALSLGRAQELPVATEQKNSTPRWVLLLDEESGETPASTKTEEVRWGGFWRRLLAFSIDLSVLSVLSSLLFYLAYVGYSVGLAAHGQTLSSDHRGVFVRILLFAWVSLVAGYFVLFHGMEGKTIGKWLLGLRVVGPHQSRITYRQAFIRWVGFIPSAIWGLGFLWILWDREKRGWHDHFAQTWVILDRPRRDR